MTSSMSSQSSIDAFAFDVRDVYNRDMPSTFYLRREKINKLQPTIKTTKLTPSPLKLCISQVPLNSHDAKSRSRTKSPADTPPAASFSRKSLIGYCSRSRKNAKGASTSLLRGMRVICSFWPFASLFFPRYEKSVGPVWFRCEEIDKQKRSTYRNVCETSRRRKTTAEDLPTTKPSSSPIHHPNAHRFLISNYATLHKTTFVSLRYART